MRWMWKQNNKNDVMFIADIDEVHIDVARVAIHDQ